jgi:sarcosine oxidase
MADYDVVVAGLGAMGSAAAYHLARRGARVAAIERFEPGHDRGSSHGQSRIFRLAYFEHPSYVPLLRRARDLWRELERVAEQKLLHAIGIVEIGPPGGSLVSGTLASSRLHDLPHEVLDAADLMRRFPAFRVPADYIGVAQPDGGFVQAEEVVRAHVALAKAEGAHIRVGETILSVEPRGNGVRVTTDHGTVEAHTVVVAAGPWMKKLLPDLAAPLRVTRQATGWFAPADQTLFLPDRFPVFLLESRHGIHYGFPLHGQDGIKIAKHHHADESVDPDLYDRHVGAADDALIRAALADHLPAANGLMLTSQTCLYTMTPDGDFVVDRVPEWPQIIVASACSGHGFKFAPVIGEIVAEMATTGTTKHDIARFRLARFHEQSALSRNAELR